MTAETIAEVALHRPDGDATSTDPFVVGPTTLDPGSGHGPLTGTSFAVKDLYDVAGTRTGAGNPERLAEAPVVGVHARAVAALVAAGATLVGKTVTDELAFSLSGTNIHYGTPTNPAAPDRVPGGSSSGSASAVASGLVDVALGTDTGGSIRVPASYTGIYGLRTTYGRISREGVVLLAPSFCTVGPFARTPELLAAAWEALRDGASVDPTPVTARPAQELLVSPEILDLADASARSVLETEIDALAARLELPLREVHPFSARELSEWRDVFRTIQMFEANELHGAWVAQHHSLGPGIAARFAASSAITQSEVVHARMAHRAFAASLGALLGEGAYLVQPSASGPAPALDLVGEEKDDLRARTLVLTAIGGLLGAPVVSLPLATVDGAPVGVAILGRPGDEDELVRLAVLARP
jgi:amidase